MPESELEDDAVVPAYYERQDDRRRLQMQRLEHG